MTSLLGLHNTHKSAHIESAGRQPANFVELAGESLAKRLAARSIRAASGCLEIQGYALRSGHVQIYLGRDRGVGRAHKVAWELVNGPIPDGLCVCHRCDNPRCVEPAHLFLGTQAENIHDSIRKGRYNAFGRQVLNAEQVYEIRRLSKAGVRQKDIAARFGIRRHSVSGIVNGHSWKHLPDVLESASESQSVTTPFSA